MMEYDKVLSQAKLDYDRNKRFVALTIRKKPRNLDDIFQAEHEKAFEEIDCMKCANCCKTTSPVFYEKDIERAAKYLGLKLGVFTDKYLMIDSDKDYVVNSAPCPFLREDNECGIYEARPNACKDYPHTNRKKVSQLLELSLKNSLICPAVAEIFNALAPPLEPKKKR